MQVVRLAHETDLAGWRDAARTLRAAGVAPDTALWTIDGDGALPAENDVLPPPAGLTAAPFTVPKGFLSLAGQVILHRSDERFALLYRLLWRLPSEPGLLRAVADPDVTRALGFARDVDAALQRMRAFLSFRPVRDDLAGVSHVAWFEPAQRVTELATPFFIRRYGAARFSILTPDVCAHWDGARLAYTAGADPADAPRDTALEGYWRARYAALFTPAGLAGAGLREAPAEWARNHADPWPIPDDAAPAEAAQMPRARQPEPDHRTVRAAVRNSRDAPYDGMAPTSLAEVMAGVDHCRRCDLWRDATQGVAGEGPRRAKLMFVGEQPGDQEDLAGRPFVGPAGQVLDRALAAAGVPRAETYVTNAVKHFKHELRGKRRIHKTPTTGEVTACRWWLDAERRIVRPRVIVALGGTAGLAVFGKPTPVARYRQQALQLPDLMKGVVTYHPSYLLRLPDEAARAEAHAMFVEDLKFAWSLVA